MIQTSSTSQTFFPKAVLSVSRDEFYGQDGEHNPLTLRVRSLKSSEIAKDNIDPSSLEFFDDKYWDLHVQNGSQERGPLPSDLQGHIFIVGTAGSFDSQTVEGSSDIYIPAEDGWQHMYSGDGMMYRLDFHHSVAAADSSENDSENPKPMGTDCQGWAKLATRLVKTPDYFVDRVLEYYANVSGAASESTNELNDLKQHIFRDAGITRLSLTLGGRNYLNTAWLAMRPASGESERIIITWDAGRPYEVDPFSLDLISPVGDNQDWQPMFDAPGLSRLFRRIPFLSQQPILTQVFPLILSAAHPVYDREDDVVFLTRASRSLNTLTQLPRIAPYFKRGFYNALNLLEETENPSGIVSILSKLFSFHTPKLIFRAIVNLVLLIAQLFIVILSWIGIGGGDHLFLYRWKGQKTSFDPTDKWEILDPDGKPIKILQSLHQMALTKDYVIISDSSFKNVLASLIPAFISPQQLTNGVRTFVNTCIRLRNIPSAVPLVQDEAERKTNRVNKLSEIREDFREYLQFLFTYFNHPQSPFTDIYVIPRPDRMEQSNSGEGNNNGSQSSDNHTPQQIRAQHFRLQPETAHFLTSYQNDDNTIVLHAGHLNSLDPAEFVKKIDEAVDTYDLKTGRIQPGDESTNQELQERSGILSNALSPNSLGAWILNLDQNSSEVRQLSREKFQLLSLYTLHDTAAETITESKTVTDIFWACGGGWKNNVTVNGFELYKSAIDPKVIDKQINQTLKSGVPASVNRIRQTVNDNETDFNKKVTLEIEDEYNFPPGYFVTSPQFSPRNGNSEDAISGYLTCIAVATDFHTIEDDSERKICEFWIFDAAKLHQGPIYRLSHPKMNLGSTLHTAWLSKIESPQPRDSYSIKDDYYVLLKDVDPMDLNQWVKGEFNRNF